MCVVVESRPQLQCTVTRSRHDLNVCATVCLTIAASMCVLRIVVIHPGCVSMIALSRLGFGRSYITQVGMRLVGGDAGLKFTRVGCGWLGV